MEGNSMQSLHVTPKGCDFACGWIAGVSGLLVGHPADTIKVRQQILGKVNAWQCMIATVKYEGVKAFYKGLAFPVISTGVMNSVFFGVYGLSLRWINQKRLDDKQPLTNIFLAGCAAGLAQLGMACPIDLIKIKMQAQTGSNKQLGAHFESGYRGPIHCMESIYRTDGIYGLYRGLVPMFFRNLDPNMHEHGSDLVKQPEKLMKESYKVVKK